MIYHDKNDIREFAKTYDGKSEETVFNESGKPTPSVRYIIIRELSRHFDDVRVTSRGGVITINPTLKEVVRVPGYLYYDGDMGKMLNGAEINGCTRVVNLTSNYALNKDFIRAVNRYIYNSGCLIGYEARSVDGMCIIGSCEYFDSTPCWRRNWKNLRRGK